MINFILLISRQGKVRLSKFYSHMPSNEKALTIKNITNLVLQRPSSLCNILEYEDDKKIIYRRYASLYFVMCIDDSDNELIAMEMIQHFVEILDSYFDSVCELDLIFNFHKAYFLLDEVFLNGELQDSSKKAVLRVCYAQDTLSETSSMVGMP